MKKLLTVLLTLFMVFTLVGCNSKQDTPVVQEPEKQEEVVEPVQEEIVGGYTEADDKNLTPELIEMFEKAFDGFVGASYTPVMLEATQVVAGTNYKFKADGTKTTNPIIQGTYYVYINKDLQGNISLLDIEVIEEHELKKFEPEVKLDTEIKKDVTQMFFWVVFYDQNGNELQRTAEKYGTIPSFKGTLPEGFINWKYKKTGKDVTTFLPITTNTYLIAVCNTTSHKSSDPTPTPSPATKTFKAVYNTSGDANTLTFYYDAVDHKGDNSNITVYDNLPTAATNPNAWGYNSIRDNVKSVVIDSSVAGYIGLTSTAYMFQSMKTATNISGAEYLDVSNVTDMSYMFNNFGGGASGSPTALNVVPDVSNWNTGNVTNMTGMFAYYGNNSSMLDKVPNVRGWNTGNVTNMQQMFQKYGHESQNFNAVPDVSNWNTGNVTNMANIFYEYGYKSTALNTVPNVSNWNTGNVTNMQQMFNGYGYTSTNISCVLDLSGWDLSIITGTNGNNVFNFNPKTFNVTIPAKTGEKSNEGGKWYYGDGTNFIAPPTDKNFTPAKEMTVADVLATVEGFPEYDTVNYEIPANAWAHGGQGKMCIYNGYLCIFQDCFVIITKVELNTALTKDTNTWTCTNEYGETFTFNMDESDLTSVEMDSDGTYPDYDGTYVPAAPAPTTYSVTYNANGATSGTAPADQTKNKDEDLTLATNTGSLAKTGYSFAGWNTAIDGKGTHYAEGATYTENAELTIYAEWVKTVADVLPEGFPTSKENGWKNDNNFSMFINGDYLIIYYDGFPIDGMVLETVLTKVGDKWMCVGEATGSFTFNMNGNSLDSIEYDDGESEACGTYEQPQ